MKFKRSIAFAAVISSLIANSFCVYAQEPEVSQNTTGVTSGIELGDFSSENNEDVQTSVFDGGDGSIASPYQISTAAQLNEIRNDLSANYILNANVDMSEIESFVPIGTFVPLGSSGEEAEIPTPEYAFTGTFDGDGYTISNLKINSPGGATVGLFGCVSGGEVKNLNAENAEVSASMMAGCIVGYLFDGEIKNVTLSNSTINGTESEMGVSMVGGIAGAGMDSKMTDCTAENVTLNLASNGTNAGVAAGGFEVCTISGVNASGTINAGDNCMGLGGVAGCDYAGDKVENCSSTVTVNAGSNAYLAGGVVGYAGSFEGKTEVKGCNYDGDMSFGNGSARIGGVIGGGFFSEAYTSYFPNPASFSVNNCTSSGNISCADGKNIGTIAGYTLLSEVSGNNTSTLKINGDDGSLIGDEDNYTVLNALQGTYQQFFTNGVFNSKFDSIWHNYCAAIVGESAAEDTVAAMKHSIGGTLYGQEAMQKFAADPSSLQFFCDFTNNVSTITIDGSNISGKDKNGNTLFSHTYHYVETADSVDFPGFRFDVFATDEDAGEFKYFAFAPDTPDSTYHIEFRYCGDYDDLLTLMSGKYAYWLAAGIRDVDIASDVVTEKVIALFCTENMQYSAERSEDSISQLNDIKGKWNCDMTLFRTLPEYANADMYIEISDDGTGNTYVDMTGSGNYASADDFYAYAYDTSANGKEGIYIAYTSDEGAEYSKYKITEENGIETLDFYTLDGEKMISYYREAEKETQTASEKRSSGGSSYKSGKSSNKASVNTKSQEKTESEKSEETVSEQTVVSEAKVNENKNIVLKIDSTSANVFGKSVGINRAPVITNGRTMLPIRFIAENLGYAVDWEQSERKAVITLDDVVIELHENSDAAFINGDEVKIDSPAFNDNGTLFVPARFIFEAFDADVAWNGSDKSVTITVK